jgi:hypothetical protein
MTENDVMMYRRREKRMLVVGVRSFAFILSLFARGHSFRGVYRAMGWMVLAVDIAWMGRDLQLENV